MVSRIVTAQFIVLSLGTVGCELIYDFEKPEMGQLVASAGSPANKGGSAGAGTGGLTNKTGSVGSVAGAGNSAGTAVSANHSGGSPSDTNNTTELSSGGASGSGAVAASAYGGAPPDTSAEPTAGGAPLTNSTTGGAAVVVGGSGGKSSSAGAVGGAAIGGTAAVGTAGRAGLTTGGVATGGVATGGVATGGVATGGVATGGVATGGVATGGVATGGVATGVTGGAGTGGATCQSVPNGFVGHCAPGCPCGSGEGPCTQPSECATGLTCGAGSGVKYGFSGSFCVPSHCVNDVIDGGETSRDCGGGCGCPVIESLAGNLTSSCALATNRDGKVVAGTASYDTLTTGLWQAALWRPGRITADFLPGSLNDPTFYNYAHGVSGDGAIVVGDIATGGGRPIYWNAAVWSASISFDLATLAAPPGTPTHRSERAMAISDDGSVIVGEARTADNLTQPFRWTSAGYQLLGLVGGVDAGTFGSAHGVSGDGAVVVGESHGNDGQWVPFRWTAATGILGLGSILGGGADGVANAANSNGSVIVGKATNASGASEAFRWTASGMVGLGVFASTSGPSSSDARGVTGDGQIVVGTSSSQAFYWDVGGGIRPLPALLLEKGFESDLSSWAFVEANAITPDGKVIVGCGTVPGATGTQAWRIWLP